MPRTTKTQPSPDDQQAPSAEEPPKKKKDANRDYTDRHKQHSSDPALAKAEIARYCALYPWYANLVDNVKATLDDRARTAPLAEFSFINPQRRTHNAR